MFDALAHLAERRTRIVIAAAVIFFIGAGSLAGSVADELEPYQADDPSTDSVIATEKLDEAGFRETGLVVLIDGADPSTPAGASRVREVERLVKRDPEVRSVTGFLQTRSPDFVAKDGSATYLAVALEPADDKGEQDAADAIATELEGEEDLSFGGFALAQKQVNVQVEEDLLRAELFVFPFVFLLSLLFFRSAVAASLPLMVGALAIVGTFLLLRVANEFADISVFALNLTTGLGLGLSIDYSLFIVSRYREEIAKDGPGLKAMRKTLQTAGRTVLFSALTVSAALASLIVFPQGFLYSMGLGGALVALLAAAIALIVLPAVLTILGERVNALAPDFLRRRADRDARAEEDGFWYRLSQFVKRRALSVAIVSGSLLILMGIPFLGVKFTSVDAQVLPEDRSARQVDDRLRGDFLPFGTTPIRVVVDGGDRREIARVSGELRETAGIVKVNPPRRVNRELAVIEASGDAPFISERGRETVRNVREIEGNGGAELLVAGAGAAFVDFQESLKDHLPYAALVVILSTLLVLFVMTGSAVLPVKQLLMNLLNLSAVFGILVFIFQDGRLEGFLDYRSQGALEQTMPILLFAMAFGLSTDYGVFLLSRIKEARDSGVSDKESVAVGLERTGRIVTAAALLFAVAVGVFATSEIVFIKENFIGVAAAVLIDASIIRAFLVPSLMEMLGAWNWWAPGPLRRLHARIGVSET